MRVIINTQLPTTGPQTKIKRIQLDFPSTVTQYDVVLLYLLFFYICCLGIIIAQESLSFFFHLDLFHVHYPTCSTDFIINFNKSIPFHEVNIQQVYNSLFMYVTIISGLWFLLLKLNLMMNIFVCVVFLSILDLFCLDKYNC